MQPDQAVELWLAALAGVPELALQLEKAGVVGENDSLGLARELRPLVFAGIEAGRNG